MRQPGALLIPQSLVLPQLAEGLIRVGWDVIAPQFPREAMAVSDAEMTERLPNGLRLPLDEVVRQVPMDLFMAAAGPAVDVRGLESFPAPFQPLVSDPAPEAPVEAAAAPEPEPRPVAAAEPPREAVLEPEPAVAPPTEPEPVVADARIDPVPDPIEERPEELPVTMVEPDPSPRSRAAARARAAGAAPWPFRARWSRRPRCRRPRPRSPGRSLRPPGPPSPRGPIRRRPPRFPPRSFRARGGGGGPTHRRAAGADRVLRRERPGGRGRHRLCDGLADGRA